MDNRRREFFNVPDKFTFELPGSAINISHLAITLLSGEPGTGKTHGACDAIFRLLKSEMIQTAFFATPRDIENRISKAISRKGHKEEALRPLMRCDILLLDEFLGSKKDTETAIFSTIRDIVFDRANGSFETPPAAADALGIPLTANPHKLRTVITTNMSLEDLKDALDDAFASRLLDRGRGLSTCISFQKRALDRSRLKERHSLSLPDWHHDLMFLAGRIIHDVTGKVRDTSKGERLICSDYATKLPPEALECALEDFGADFHNLLVEIRSEFSHGQAQPQNPVQAHA